MVGSTLVGEALDFRVGGKEDRLCDILAFMSTSGCGDEVVNGVVGNNNIRSSRSTLPSLHYPLFTLCFHFT